MIGLYLNSRIRIMFLHILQQRLKQKEKAAKTGSPLPQDDIEDDPELAALRTVALLSKNQKKEQKRVRVFGFREEVAISN